MEEDEDAARIKIMEMELAVEKLKLAQRVKEGAAKSAAAKAAHDVAEAAKTAQDEETRAEAKKKAARAEKEKAAADERAARAESEKKGSTSRSR